MTRAEEKEGIITEQQIEELANKISEGIKQKEESGKKDRSVKVDTKTGLLVRITRNQEQSKFYISIVPKGGHPVYNKIIFDSSEKIREFLNDLKNFIKEREDVILAIDKLNERTEKKSETTV
ncbi:MAG: hypothetical protein NZ927_01035 [Candidatus Calescibacterium sp.]|nr:hypothetical protein [Candidatus Calescibacterium sp.]MCX7733703.1 hypothetical protein [bacterium]MDW8087513.1 hypothetical protein [Candidatus Calescibacterium sp.]